MCSYNHTYLVKCVFPRDMWSPTQKTHITMNICFAGRGTHITTNMCSPMCTKIHIFLVICAPLPFIHISLVTVVPIVPVVPVVEVINLTPLSCCTSVVQWMYNSGLWASEVLRRPDKTDVSPLLNTSAEKHSLFFKRCLGRTGIFHLQVSTIHGP